MCYQQKHKYHNTYNDFMSGKLLEKIAMIQNVEHIGWVQWAQRKSKNMAMLLKKTKSKIAILIKPISDQMKAEHLLKLCEPS